MIAAPCPWSRRCVTCPALQARPTARTRAGRTTGNIAHTLLFGLDAEKQNNGSRAYTGDTGPLDIQNLANKEYVSTCYQAVGDRNQCLYGQERTVALTAKYRF